MIKGISTKRIKRITGKVFPFLLLVLYFVGTSHPELLHSFAHSHDAFVVHSEEQEKDPCHRLIYHDDAERGCGHDSHLIVSDRCHMCDLAYHVDHTILSDLAFSTVEFSSAQFDHYKVDLDSYWAVRSSSRAPPAKRASSRNESDDGAAATTSRARSGDMSRPR